MTNVELIKELLATVENHYRGWNIPSVEYWMPFNKPLED